MCFFYRATEKKQNTCFGESRENAHGSVISIILFIVSVISEVILDTMLEDVGLLEIHYFFLLFGMTGRPKRPRRCWKVAVCNC